MQDDEKYKLSEKTKKEMITFFLKTSYKRKLEKEKAFLSEKQEINGGKKDNEKEK